MAKDILVNTQSGDFLASEDVTQTAYWNVVWGKLFDSDKSEYMNIVVPSGYINDVHLKDGQYECSVSAEYYPVNSEFLARLVVQNVATGGYNLIQDYITDAPSEMGVEYYPTYTGRAKSIMACQLPSIDVDGHFKLSFQQYTNNNFSRAIICSAKDADFNIGQSDSQSAQLLVRCAPGKYYRYPTTGLDLVQYINSVVEHTDMTESLISQFSSDYKKISQAEFDSSTGDLQVVFTGTNEASDENLTDISLLDVELFRIADDDFIRSLYKSAHNISTDSAEFIDGLTSGSFLGIFDIGASASLDKITITSIQKGVISGDGSIKSSNTDYVATMELDAGTMYAINYDESIVKKLNSTWYHEPLFAIYSDKEMIYFDEPFVSDSALELATFKDSFQNRRCFIPLKDLTIKFYAGTSATWLDDTDFGVRPLVNEITNYNSILGISANTINGQLTATISVQSDIQNVKIDVQTNKILAIK